MNYESVLNLLKSTSFDNGNSISEVLNKEKELSIIFPEALKKFYLIFGKNKKFRKKVNEYKLLEELKFNEKDELIFYEDYQTGLRCFFKKGDLLQQDYKFYWSTEIDKKWKYESRQIYSDIESICLQTVLYSIENRGINFGVSNQEVKLVYNHFDKLGSLRGGLNMTFYQNNPNHLIGVIVSDDSNMVSICSNNQSDFEYILEKIKIDWDFLMKKNEIIIKRFGGIG